jgi:hypothetical protein
MARDPAVEPAPEPAENAGSEPDRLPTGIDTYADGTETDEIDKKYWEQCLSDAERAEADWRKRGRDIIKIYRNEGHYEGPNRRKTSATQTFNILYSNTEVMQPAVYGKPPTPVVRSRFVKKSAPPQPMPMPGMLPPAGGMPPMMGALPPAPPVGGPPGMQPPPGPSPNAPGGGSPTGMPPPMPMGPPPMTGQPAPMPTDNSVGIDINLQGLQPPPPPPPAPPPAPMPDPGMMPPGLLPLPAGMPEQKDIETAASVMEKALAIVLDDDVSHEAIRAAVKDVLLPGRGTCRVRWKPVIETSLTEPDDLPPEAAEAALPPAQDTKVWETVNDEYVYWEDILYDPVRQFADGSWLAFRHLFDRQSLLTEFPDSEELNRLKDLNKLDDLLRWTEESAAKNAIGGGGALRTADKLGDVIKKAMVWEIWDKTSRKIIWYIRETSGIVLRVDDDTLQLNNFFPCPKPLLAVTSTDTMLPRAYFDLYANLAADIEEISERISRLTEKIKVRGGYNSASREIADMLTSDDGKMIPIVGVDMMNGGLQNHIWIVPIVDWVNALKELFLARNEVRQAIYEIMGISDLMRGATNPHETATAQRIKGTMGVGRLSDQKQLVANFVRDLIRMKAEIIAKNFDAQTLTKMTGEEVTPEVFNILRSDFSRTCSIDIETDSTVELDESIEQESNAKILMTLQGIMTGAAGLLQLQVLPPPMVMQFTLELIKMMLHPIRGSRGIIELINDFQEQIQAQIMAPPMPMPMMGPPGAPPGAPPMGPSGPVPGPPTHLGAGPPMMPPPMNGALQ